MPPGEAFITLDGPVLEENHKIQLLNNKTAFIFAVGTITWVNKSGINYLDFCKFTRGDSGAVWFNCQNHNGYRK